MRTQGKTTKLSKARENAGNLVVIGFGFASDWLREGREFSGPITEWSKAKTKQFRSALTLNQELLYTSSAVSINTAPTNNSSLHSRIIAPGQVIGKSVIGTDNSPFSELLSPGECGLLWELLYLDYHISGDRNLR